MTKEEQNNLNEEKKMTLEEMMAENLRMTEEIHEMTKKIKGYITFQKIMSFVYFLLIVTPILISLIYLPPLISSVLGQYQVLFGEENSLPIDSLLKGGAGGIDINKISPEILKMLEKK